ncbi:MAG: GNAT family N-acetyltransferase [Aestuariibacter sp.]
MTTEIVIVDFNNPLHCRDLPEMLDSYACDPMGGGTPLAEKIKAQLMTELSKLPYYVGFLVYQNDKPVAFANCFMGFSTFACKALLNIHDFAVLPEHRGQGLSQMLMKAIAAKAKELGCCKLTLEVLSGNASAINAYKKFGFTLYQLDEKAGTAQFMECSLS